MNVTSSPGYTLESSPSASVFLNAKSKISILTSSISLSSSSPFSFSVASFCVTSFDGLSSGVESISSGLSPRSSLADWISAMFADRPAVASASTVNETVTVSIPSGPIGPGIVMVEGPFAVNPLGAKSSTTIFEAGTDP